MEGHYKQRGGIGIGAKLPTDVGFILERAYREKPIQHVARDGLHVVIAVDQSGNPVTTSAVENLALAE